MGPSYATDELRRLKYVAPEGDELLWGVYRSIQDATVGKPMAGDPLPCNGSWDRVLGFVRRHRLVNGLHEAVSLGYIVIDDPATEALEAELLGVAAGQLRILASAQRVAGLLQSHDIDFRLLKGLATGNLDYPNPSLRETSDVDLLIPPGSFDRAVSVLEANGAQRKPQKLDAYVGVETTMTDSTGVELDLHRRLFRFGWDHDEVAFSSGDSVGRLGLALDRSLRFEHAVAHLLISPFGHRNLSSLLDVATLASEHGSAQILSPAFGDMAVWLTGSTAERPPAQSLLERAHLSDRRRPVLEVAASLRDAQTWSSRARLLSAHVGAVRSPVFEATAT